MLRQKPKFILFSLISFIIFGFFSRAGQANETFQKAIAAYDSGEYDKSVSLFESQLKDHPRNGHLLFNLGNAYFRQGHLGKSMAAYLGARFYLPRDPDVKANLNFIHNQIKDRLDIKASEDWRSYLTFWATAITANEMWWVMAWFFALSFLWLFICQLIKKLRTFQLIGWVGIFIALFIGLGASLSRLNQTYPAAVISEKALVRSGPGEHNTALFELHEGAPLFLKRQEGSWYQIELSDSKKGWISQNEILTYTWPKN